MRRKNPTEAVHNDDLQEWIQELVIGAAYMEGPEQAAKDALAIFTVYWVASQTGDKAEMERAEAALSEGDLYYSIRLECARRVKHIREHIPNAWKLFMSLLHQRCLPPPLRRKVEAAVRSWARSRVVIKPKQRGRAWEIEAEARVYLSELEEIRSQISTAKEAYAAPEQCATSEEAKELRMEVGPFTLVNSGGFSQEFMRGSADALGQAVVLLQKKGLGFVCYGEAHMTKRVASANVAAQYVIGTDTFQVKGTKKSGPEVVGYIIHELGHRLHHKFMGKEVQAEVRRMYREAKRREDDWKYSGAVEKMLPKIGDTYVEGRKEFVVTAIQPTKIILKLKGYEQEKFSAHIAPEAWAQNMRARTGQIPDYGFVNLYARRNEEENFCEMLRMYCMGKLPASQAALIEPVVQQAIKDAASLPARNPAEPLDMQVDRFLASGYLRVDPLKYRTIFAKHAAEIGQPEPVGEMLGCGGFGCVWRTSSPGVVLKATKDDSEIRIASMLMNSPTAPEGFVRYLDRGQADGFELLWREEVDPYRGKNDARLDAYNLYAKTAREIYDWAEYKDEWNELVKVYAERMDGWKITLPKKGAKGAVPAMVGGKLVDLSWWEPSDDYEEQMAMHFVASWRVARLAATRMKKSTELRLVAEAILWAMSKGIMLCDVSYANLGWVKLHSKPALVIYDPGHTVDVPPTREA